MLRISPKVILSLLIATGVSLSSCVEHNFPSPVVDCSTTAEISFAQEIKPIINTKCSNSGCHDGSLGIDKDWTNALTLQGKSSEVKHRVLLPDSDTKQMPLSGSISQEQRQLLVCWVEQGAVITN